MPRSAIAVTYYPPFVVSPSNHERHVALRQAPFDKLRTNGEPADVTVIATFSAQARCGPWDANHCASARTTEVCIWRSGTDQYFRSNRSFSLVETKRNPRCS